MNGSPPPIAIEPMQVDDIPRVLEIDRLSFPLPWSAAAYRYELTQNPNSHFQVARAADAAAPASEAPAAPAGPGTWLDSLRRLWPGRPAPNGGLVVGYVGFWYIVDEAHISTLAVHPDWRRQGVGEALLVAAMERGLDLGAIKATLEVRMTNAAAQNLYGHYAFEVVGRRKHYYRDNGEDALLMTAETGPAYREQMRQVFAQRRAREGAREHE